MAKLYAQGLSGAFGVSPPDKAPGNTQGGKKKALVGVFVSNGADTAAGDTIVIGRLPIGAVFTGGALAISAAVTGTVAVGSAALPGKYRGTGGQGTLDVPVVFGRIQGLTQGALAAEEEVILTVGGNALAAGTYVVIIEFTSLA